MKLYIVRHGQAHSFAPSDSERALTEHGQLEVSALWNKLSEHVVLDQLIASPYTRAQQTADQILACQQQAHSGHELVIETCPLVTPDSGVVPALDWLATHVNGESVALVSHMPLVSLLTAVLLNESHRRHFATGAVACIECPVPASGLGELCWLERP